VGVQVGEARKKKDGRVDGKRTEGKGEGGERGGCVNRAL